MGGGEEAIFDNDSRERGKVSLYFQLYLVFWFLLPLFPFGKGEEGKEKPKHEIKFKIKSLKKLE